MKIIVSPVNQINQIIASENPQHLISLLSQNDMIDTPHDIDTANHLKLAVNDITSPVPALIEPRAEHIQRLLEFADTWDQSTPLLIHCFAGISRSTAAALILLCSISRERQEIDMAKTVRRASPHASPNALLIAHGDEVLGLDGRLIDAVEKMGKSVFVPLACPFSIPISMGMPVS
jgi:predicted protein tyrosine phosphatase